MQKPGVIQTSKGTSPDWCVDENGKLSEGWIWIPHSDGKRPTRVRCPVCKKRFTPQTRDLEAYGGFSFEAGYFLPIHHKK